MLAKWALETGVRVRPDLRIQVRTWGPSPVRIVLLHGFGQGSFVWRSFAAAMSHLGCASIDLRGHGDSDHDPWADYSLAAHVADAVSVANALDLREFVLVGHSLGAFVSILAAQQLQRRIRGLILVDGGPELNGAAVDHIRRQFVEQPWRYWSIDAFATHLQAMLPLAPPQLIAQMAIDSLRLLPDGCFELKADRALALPMGVDHKAGDAELWRALQGFREQMLLVRGAHSAVCPRRWAERFAQQVPQARIETISRAGHAVMLDNPLGFLNVVEDFIARTFEGPPSALPNQGLWNGKAEVS